VGTDQYIAPEAYSGIWSPASDIFSLGVVLFRLLNGRFPFDPRLFNDGPGENYVGGAKMEEIRKSLEASTIDYHRRIRGAPEEDLQALSLCRRMLAMDPQERPTAEEALAHPWLLAEEQGVPQMAVTPRQGDSLPSPVRRSLQSLPDESKSEELEPLSSTPKRSLLQLPGSLSLEAWKSQPQPLTPPSVEAPSVHDGKAMAEAVLRQASESPVSANQDSNCSLEAALLPGCVVEEGSKETTSKCSGGGGTVS